MAIIPANPSNPSGPPGGSSFPKPKVPSPAGSFGGPSPSRPPGGGFSPGGGGSRGRAPYPQQNQNKDEHRINDRIRVPQVRLIDEKGEQVGIVPTIQALTMARDRGLDLMEVSPNAQPPVCKICDYGKFKYEKKKKEHQAKKKQVVIKVKEIQLRPQTDEHDLEYKFKNVREFLIEGDKAKITIMFRGREIVYLEQGHKMLQRLIEQVRDVANVEYPPKLEGKKLIMILAPGAAKKSTGPSIIVTPRSTVSPVAQPVAVGPVAVAPVVVPVPASIPAPGAANSQSGNNDGV